MNDQVWFRGRLKRAVEFDQRLEQDMGLFQKIASLAHQFLDRQPPQSDVQRLIVVLLFTRLTESVEAIIVLCRLGFEAEASVVTRSSFETLLKLQLCARDKDFTQRYLSKATFTQTKLAQAISKLEDPELADLKAMGEKFSRSLRKELESAPAPNLGSIEKQAQLAGLGDYYNSVWRISNQPVHAEPQVLLRHMDLDNQGRIVRGLRLMPSLEDAEPERLIGMASDFLLRGMEAFLPSMGVDYHAGVEQLKQNFNAVAGARTGSRVKGRP